MGVVDCTPRIQVLSNVSHFVKTEKKCFEVLFGSAMNIALIKTCGRITVLYGRNLSRKYEDTRRKNIGASVASIRKNIFSLFNQFSSLSLCISVKVYLIKKLAHPGSFFSLYCTTSCYPYCSIFTLSKAHYNTNRKKNL